MKIHPLKAYRKKLTLTQSQLAQILGVSRATITHIEQGRRRITPENAREWERKIPLRKSVLCPEIFGHSKAAA